MLQLKDKSLTEITLTERYFLYLKLKDKSLTKITLNEKLLFIFTT